MATITYDASENTGELTAEEQESLAVGEKMQQEEAQLLAGKYKDAEELEKAYIELQSKLGTEPAKPEAEAEPEVQEEEEAEPESETDFFDELWNEAQSDSEEYSADIIEKLKKGEQIVIGDLKLDKQLIDKVNKFAPIKHILKNKSGNKHEIIELLDDISRDLMNYDLEFRIQELESKFSEDLSETTFNELKELKKLQNIN